jgi:hypothetical protein
VNDAIGVSRLPLAEQRFVVPPQVARIATWRYIVVRQPRQQREHGLDVLWAGVNYPYTRRAQFAVPSSSRVL